MGSLKGCIKRRCSYGRIRYRIKNFWYELVYAWQRAWRGYDFIDLMDMSGELEQRIIILLKDLRSFKHGLWYDDEKDRVVTEEEATAAFDELIDKFENINEEKVEIDLYGSPIGQHFWDMNMYLQISKEQQRRRDEAFMLLSKSSYFLCD